MQQSSVAEDRKWRAGVGVALAWPFFVATLLTNVGPAGTFLEPALGLTATDIGILLAASSLSHTFFQLLTGAVVDRWGTRPAILASCAIGLLAQAGIALAAPWGVLLALRIVLGIATSLGWVAAAIVIAELAPRRHLTALQGIYGASFHLGLMAQLASTAPLALLVGWRQLFLFQAAMVLVVLAAAALVLPRGSAARAAARGASLRSILLHPRVLATGLLHLGTYGAYMGVVPWVARYLEQSQQLSPELAGVLSASLALGAVLARGVGGRLATGRESVVMLASPVLTAALVTTLALAPSNWLAVTLLLMLGLASSLPFGAIFSVAVSILGRAAAARSLAVTVLVGNLGLLLFPPAVGTLFDAFGDLRPGFLVVAAASLVAGLAGAILYRLAPDRPTAR